MSMNSTSSTVATVALAIERFSAGDDEGFLALVDPDVVVWASPQLTHRVVLEGRDQLATWCREARARWSAIRFGHGELAQDGAGVFVELDVLSESRPGGSGGSAYRLPIAVFFRDELVAEVVPHLDRAAAIAALRAALR